MIKFQILIILIIFLVLFILNKYLNITENYTPLINQDFKKILLENKYELNESDKKIKYCDLDNKCNEKSYKLSFNNVNSVRLVINKYETNHFLRTNGVTNVPHSLIIDLSDIDKILDQMRKNNISYPIVLKPVDGTFGIDVYTSIMDKTQLIETIKILKEKNYTTYLLEGMFYGDNYRVFVFNNEVIDIIKREKPYVIGDGINTINYLNELRNNEQIKNNFFPLKELDIYYLKTQNYRPTDIPKLGEKVYVSNVINLHNGAIPSKIDINKVPIENIKLFQKVTNVLGLNCSGIDYLSNNIYEKYSSDRTNKTNIILEVNGTPDVGIHLIFDKDDKFYHNIKNRIFN
jgi:glutathione synthase/RimK-type ligase-like ATP-grasp enzyme